MKFWWEDNHHLFEKEKELLSKYYPSLKFFIENNTVAIKGLLDIENIDSYEIEIIIPDNYPASLPIVKEVGGDIPREVDRHMYDNGVCCLAINNEIIEKYKNQYFLKNFIDDFVKPFFANQLYFEQTGEWLNGEYSHGAEGKLEYISDKTGIGDKELLLKFIKLALQKIPNLNKKCPCQKNKPLKRCHLNTVLQIKRLLPDL